MTTGHITVTHFTVKGGPIPHCPPPIVVAKQQH
jgi:hypothetical protein